MWERIRFARYPLRFERAFEDDDRGPVKACFHPEARYVIEGSATEWDGETRGPDAIAALFKRMLDELDRKLQKRIPGLTAWPRVRAGELQLELRDLMDAEECRRWGALVGVVPRAATS